MNNTNQSSLNNRILYEQLELLYAALPSSIFANLINAFLLVYVLSGHINSQILVIWLIAVILIGLGRYLSFRIYKRQVHDELNINKWKLLIYLGSIASAISWGAATIILFVPAELGYQVFLAFVIAGMSAGAVSSLSMLKLPIIAYLSLSLIPLGIRMFIEGGEINIAMGVMTFLFMMMLVITAIRTYKTVYENILLRFEAYKNEKVIRESEEKYRGIFDAAPVGIIQYDSTGRILGGNAAANRIFSLSSEALKKIDLTALNGNLPFEEAIKKSLTGNFSHFNGDTTIFNTDKNLPIKIYFKGLVGIKKEVIGGVAIVEDISEQKRVEKLKNEFVSTVSHELRTPLTAIKGSIDLLEHVDNAARPQLVDMLKRNTNRLVSLINDLLDIDKIVSGNVSFDFQQYEVMQLIDVAVADNQGYAREHKTEIAIDHRVDNERITIDQGRFNQVMANLLSNAAKFTREGTVVTVSVNRSGDRIVIKVKDQGEGIPDSFREKIFARFTQADSSTTRKKGGTGLGLYITKQLVEAMNGKISYETKAGEGTEFIVEFLAL